MGYLVALAAAGRTYHRSQLEYHESHDHLSSAGAKYFAQKEALSDRVLRTQLVSVIMQHGSLDGNRGEEALPRCVVSRKENFEKYKLSHTDVVPPRRFASACCGTLSLS